jgi:hypothetical protein
MLETGPFDDFVGSSTDLKKFESQNMYQEYILIKNHS